MKNYLFSTTRQYNPGDEFILFGVINILEEMGSRFNPVIFNRNQEVNPALAFLNPLRRIKSQSKLVKVLGSIFRVSQVDNSFKDVHDLDFIDCVVFAGSPEWKTPRLYPLYKKMKGFKGPVLYLGLGAFSENEKIPFFAKKALKEASVIAYRTQMLDEVLRDYDNSTLMPCPALFSAGIKVCNYEINNKVAITYGTAKASKGNHVSQSAASLMEEAYLFLIDKGYECDIVCHYIDEIPEAKRLFPKAEIRYSFDAKDYIDIYKSYSAVVTSRVHAVGMCASMGIPGLLIAHDGRADTVRGFKAEVFSDSGSIEEFHDSILDLMERRSELSESILTHKSETLNRYKDLLSNVVV